MTHEDPFASPNADRTIIVPTPGGRSAPSSAAATGYPQSAPSLALDEAVPASGLNPLVTTANPLLNAVPQLQATLQHPDPAGLRDRLAQGIRTFESRARAANVPPEKVVAARYALCTLLDEVAASTPWGGSGIWARHSLLVLFHNEAWGGEKFFQLLAKLAENPAANRDLLDLMYICLALGFEGRYRVIENGRAQLEALRERLAQLLRRERGEYERELSPRWQPATVQRAHLFTVLPLWVAAAACAVILLAVYLGFNYRLNSASDPLFAQIQAVRVKAPIPEPVPPPPARPRLAGFLAREIQEGLVAVRDEANRSIVTLRGDGLFAPGSATVSEPFVPVLNRIADALKAVEGQVLVTGHTDNQPIRSARFPSNWHLSQERARSVMQLLVAKGTPASRLKAEGRAEAEPIAPNDTAANRARNRRVEITLFVARSG